MNALEMLQYQPAPAALAKRVILVTGAGQGLGKSIALASARLGATLILHGRDAEKLETLYDEIVREGGAEPLLFPLDLSKATELDFDQMAGAIEAQLGSLSGIVHCASHLLLPAPMEQQRLKDWAHAYQVNVAAPMAITRSCARLLRAAQDASVIFTGETHGQHPAAFWGGFAAAGSALITLTRILAAEWAHLEKLRVNMIIPGKIDSPQRSKTHPGEHLKERASIDSVLPAYLYLLAADSRGATGGIFEFNPVPSP